MRGLPAKFNDLLALIVMVGMPSLWYVSGWKEAIITATLPIMTLVAQYYYRKKSRD